MFGTDANELGKYEAAKPLLERWGKLALTPTRRSRGAHGDLRLRTRDRESRETGWGALSDDGLIIATPDKDKSWKVSAIHYLAL